MPEASSSLSASFHGLLPGTNIFMMYSFARAFLAQNSASGKGTVEGGGGCDVATEVGAEDEGGRRDEDCGTVDAGCCGCLRSPDCDAVAVVVVVVVEPGDVFTVAGVAGVAAGVVAVLDFAVVIVAAEAVEEEEVCLVAFFEELDLDFLLGILTVSQEGGCLTGLAGLLLQV